MNNKKGKFSKKAKDILTKKEAISISDFLDDSGRDDNIYLIPVELIQDNPYQPRKHFDEGKLNDLAESIKEHGVIQPIVIQKEDDNIILVAGERRLRASKLAGLEKIPAILTKGNALEISLIENIQRENLDPFEEAEALQTMIDKYNYTQENLAKAVGKSRPSITKSLSLNKIPKEIKDKCSRVNIPKRTLFEIARQKTEELMSSVAEKVINFDLKAEDVKKIRKGNEKKKPKSEVKNVVFKKMKAFNKYINTIEDDVENDQTEILKEIESIQNRLAELLKKLEK
jgi:ParB family chromosome partitioning protein